MFTVKQRVFGEAADGRTILLYTAGQEISDDEARRAGLLAGKPGKAKAASGLVLEGQGSAPDDAPATKKLERMNLAELRALCEAEGIDPGDATLRADFITAIEMARAAGVAGKNQEAATEGDAAAGDSAED